MNDGIVVGFFAVVTGLITWLLHLRVSKLERWANLNIDLRSQKLDQRKREIDNEPPRVRSMWDEE